MYPAGPKRRRPRDRRAQRSHSNSNNRGGPRPSLHQLQLRVKLSRETLLKVTPTAVMTSSSGSIPATQKKEAGTSQGNPRQVPRCS
mmetsp:Transcript_20156/g.42560  ORF Transcript_20156/g.42560 Transcript_20156/m.42560 type:complete len:86 (-) Transcript_20156:42-299(-)